MDDVAFDGGLDGGALLFPVGLKFVKRTRFENIAAQYMGANLGPLFDDDHGQLLTVCCGQLRQAAGGSKSGRPPTDDYDIEFHRVPLGMFRHARFFLSRTGAV